MIPRMVRTPLVLLCFLALPACDLLVGQAIEGSGVPSSLTVDVADVTEVRFSVPGDLLIEQGPAEDLQVEGDDNILENLLIRVRNGRLEIGTEDRVRLRPQAPLRFRLQVPELTEVNLAGTGHIDISEFQADELTVQMAGSGSVAAPDLWAETLVVDVAGSGTFESWGTAARQDIRIAGSGEIDLSDLDGREVQVDIAGSGTVDLRASESLDARIAGSGTVRYTGDAEVSTSIAGSGTVRRAN